LKLSHWKSFDETLSRSAVELTALRVLPSWILMGELSGAGRGKGEGAKTILDQPLIVRPTCWPENEF